MSANLNAISAFFAVGKFYSVDIKLHGIGTTIAKIEIEAETPRDLLDAWEMQATAFISCAEDVFGANVTKVGNNHHFYVDGDSLAGIWLTLMHSVTTDSFLGKDNEPSLIGRIAHLCVMPNYGKTEVNPRS